MPDLNVRNPKVIQELKDILRFWLDLGVDGFRMDAVAHLFEAEDFGNEDIPRGTNRPYADFEHPKTYNLPEVVDLLKEFRKVLDDKTAEDEYNPRIMLTEAYLDNQDLMAYYGANVGNHSDHSGDASHAPLNFGLVSLGENGQKLTASLLNERITSYLEARPSDDYWPNFHIGNHDKDRAASRFGEELVDAINMVYLFLPGTPITYYGEELGMVNNEALRNSRDERAVARTPMQWTADGPSAGFSTAPGWLAVNPNYDRVNVAEQESSQESHLKVFRQLANLRSESSSVLFGSVDTLVNDTVFAFSRVKKGNPGYLVAVNLGDEDLEAVDVSSLPNLPSTGTISLRSARQSPPAEEEAKELSLSSFPLKKKEGVLITFVPKF